MTFAQVLLLGCLFLVVLLGAARSPPLMVMIGVGAFIRIALALFDQGGDFALPWSGKDSETFYRYALDWSIGPLSEHLAAFDPRSAWVYPWGMGFIMRVFGEDYLYLRVVNCVLGCAISVVLFHCARLLGLPRRSQIAAAGLYLFFPTAVILNAVLLREAIITLFLAMSVWGVISYYHSGQIRGFIVAFAGFVFATMFHGGMIVVLLTFLALNVSVRVREVEDRSRRSVMAQSILKRLSIAVLGVALTVVIATTVQVSKVGSIMDLGSAVAERAERLSARGAKGGSAYPSWVTDKATNPVIIIPKMAYFIASPFPWEYRGVADIAAGVIGLVFLVFTICVLKVRSFGPAGVALCVLTVVALFAFAFGTDNVGTSLRHRSKFLPFFIICSIWASAHWPVFSSSSNNEDKVRNGGRP